MERAEQVSILGEGLEVWNKWRKEHPTEVIDLAGVDLRNVKFGLLPALERANAQGLIPEHSSWSFIYNEIIGYDVMPLDLRDANLTGANLDGADLIMADCRRADFSAASLKAANLHRANLSSVRFVDADLSSADLRASDLSSAVLIRTNLEGADLGYSNVYGISVWDTRGIPADETFLAVNPPQEADLRINRLALAQLMYFLSRSGNARDLIDALASKLVLILGNFKDERMAVLKSVHSALAGRGFEPVIFDFARPSSKDTTGAIETFARLALFVIADLTDPSSVPHELATTVPFLRTTPVVLVRQTGAKGYSMAQDLLAYPWVLGIHEYETSNSLLASLPVLVQQVDVLIAKLRPPAEH